MPHAGEGGPAAPLLTPHSPPSGVRVAGGLRAGDAAWFWGAPGAAGCRTLPLAVGDDGVSIKISANLLTVQKACLSAAPFPRPWQGDSQASLGARQPLLFSSAESPGCGPDYGQVIRAVS